MSEHSLVWYFQSIALFNRQEQKAPQYCGEPSPLGGFEVTLTGRF